MGRRARGVADVAETRTVLETLAQIASLVVLVMLGVGFAARYVPPETGWAVQLFGLGLPWTAAGAGLAALCWTLRKRWGMALGLGGAVACVLLRASGGVENGGGPLFDGPRLTVVSFNGKAGAGNASLERMAELLHEVDPDLVAMQELPVRVEPNGYMASVPLIVPLIQGGYPLVKTDGTGWQVHLRPTFTRLQVRGSSQPLTESTPEGLWERGGVVRSEVEWEGQPIAIYNVHLHSFGSERPWKDGTLLSPKAWRSALHTYREDFRTRAEQARQLRWWLDQEPLPFLVCGDFNSTPANWVYGHIAHGLQDSFRARGEGWGMTFPARWPLVRIDYVLASPHWRVHRAFVYDGLSSDHRPVIAELVLMSVAGREAPAP